MPKLREWHLRQQELKGINLQEPPAPVLFFLCALLRRVPRWDFILQVHCNASFWAMQKRRLDASSHFKMINRDIEIMVNDNDTSVLS